MRFCQPHWDKLREGVELRGMDHLGARSAVEVMIGAQEGFTGTRFDPLMGSFFDITTRFINNVAKSGEEALERLMRQVDLCPLCEVQKSWEACLQHPDKAPENGADAQAWIDKTLDGALKYAREHGLVGRPS